MDLSKAFEEFCSNLKNLDIEEISKKYKGITKKLNQSYRESESDSDFCLQVGSYGRRTGVKGISDLDMVYEIPKKLFDKYDAYETKGQSSLLQDIKNTLLEKYSNTDIKGDGQVVVISFSKVDVEVLPSLLQSDNTYLHPNSNNGGSWDKTDPRSEIEAMKTLNNSTDEKFRDLCRMVRAWKNKNGVAISGYFIDTIVYKFLNNNSDYDGKRFSIYQELVRDFFKFLSEEDEDQNYWVVPGSKNRVEANNFNKEALQAYENIEEAIEKNENKTVYKNWKSIFGREFPKQEERQNSITKSTDFEKDYTDTEVFIEDMFPINISKHLRIDCNVTQDGFRKELLSRINFLKYNKQLDFFISEGEITYEEEIFWKVKNEGIEAEKRNEIRGQILKGHSTKTEHTSFNGKHYVECYIIRNGICIARNKLIVPINNY